MIYQVDNQSVGVVFDEPKKRQQMQIVWKRQQLSM